MSNSIDTELYSILEDAMPQGKERREVFHRALRSTANGEFKKTDNALARMTGKKPETWDSKDFSDHENKVGDKYQKLVTSKGKEKFVNNVNRYRDKHIENSKKRTGEMFTKTYDKLSKNDKGRFAIESALENELGSIEFN